MDEEQEEIILEDDTEQVEIKSIQEYNCLTEWKQQRLK